MNFCIPAAEKFTILRFGSDSQVQIQIQDEIHIQIHIHLTLNYCSPY